MYDRVEIFDFLACQVYVIAPFTITLGWKGANVTEAAYLKSERAKIYESGGIKSRQEKFLISLDFLFDF
jgi:hypothetical protein